MVDAKQSSIEKKFYRGISFEEALKITDPGIENLDDLFQLMTRANYLRQLHKGSSVITCAIVNAKSGGCSEDCAFCSQSAFNKTDISRYPLLLDEEILDRARKAQKNGASEFSIVTSGKSAAGGDELGRIETSIFKLRESTGLVCCASLGTLGYKDLARLKSSGLQIFHHNLETSRRFFPSICSTHSYEDNLQTIKQAKRVGLKVCCGGIFGMGESWRDRLELLFELKDLEVDSIPINFLNPISGTRLQNQSLLSPFEALKIIAVSRLVYPSVNIVICGGRELTLRDLGSWIFFAGANGILIGDYLTTKGRSASDDLRMIYDQGLKPEGRVF